jgi:hypothetical protein
VANGRDLRKISPGINPELGRKGRNDNVMEDDDPRSSILDLQAGFI